MRMLMTGATSGIGLVAARKLVADGAELTIGVRNPAAAPADLKAACSLLPLDLADLDAVKRFADEAVRLPPFDVLVLNAGLQVTSEQTSAQGLELTFATNHLAHFLLVERLTLGLRDGGRVVVTSSGTHDPDTRSGMPPPRTTNVRTIAYPRTDPTRDANAGTAGRRAYSTSKLFNVMTARELAVRLATRRPDIAVAAYDPAYVPNTGLARGYPAWARFLVARILPVVLRGPWVSTPEVSGGHLADLATSPAHEAIRGGYFSVRSLKLEEVGPSAMARDGAACAKLWDDSRDLLVELGVSRETLSL